MSNPKRIRTSSVLAAALIVAVPLVLQAGASPAGAAGKPHSTTLVYDSFSKPGGYTMTDYAAKWGNPYGPGEMALDDTRNFAGSRFNVSAAPFRTAWDFSVFDHLKYIAISNQAFPVPADGAVEISSTIQASTPGTEPGRIIHGVYTATGAPYAEPTLEGQQAGAVMNVVNFATGQLFDWFVSGNTAFALIERLPSNVTGNTNDTSSPDYVGRQKMYTQIIKEVPITPGVAHKVSIRFSRNASGASVDYFLDDALVAHADRVGVPLDAQDEDYTGIYPSLGAGEEIGQKINHLVIGHGLFSLLDAFPFQHPEAPELSVSIPVAERAFGQGAIASFDNFKVKTTTNK